MDVREKLALSVCNATQKTNFKCEFNCEKKGKCAYCLVMADQMIANGVTVQEEAKLYWKPVNPGEWNLTCSACDSHLGCREGAKHCPECGAKFVYPKAIMPQPPKGE